MYQLLVGVVCCCETLDQWGVVDWFGFTGCDRLLKGVVKHKLVIGGCCETQIGGWWLGES